MRRVTATRLQQAKQMVPHFYLHADCRVDALVDMRQQWNGRKGATKISLTDLIVFAVSRALQKVPQANSAFAGSAVRVFRSVDIAAGQLLLRERGMAIELPDDGPFAEAPLDVVSRSRVVAGASPGVCRRLSAALLA